MLAVGQGPKAGNVIGIADHRMISDGFVSGSSLRPFSGIVERED